MKTQLFNLKLCSGFLDLCQQTFTHESDCRVCVGTNGGVNLACKDSCKQDGEKLDLCKDRESALNLVFPLPTKLLKQLAFLLFGAVTAVFQQVSKALGLV